MDMSDAWTFANVSSLGILGRQQNERWPAVVMKKYSHSEYQRKGPVNAAVLRLSEKFSGLSEQVCTYGTDGATKSEFDGPPLWSHIEAPINDDEYQNACMRKALARLGCRIGLTSSLLSYCLRKRAAYLLAINYTEEECCGRMGHKTGDGVYWTHYRDKLLGCRLSSDSKRH